MTNRTRGRRRAQRLAGALLLPGLLALGACKNLDNVGADAGDAGVVPTVDGSVTDASLDCEGDAECAQHADAALPAEKTTPCPDESYVCGPNQACLAPEQNPGQTSYWDPKGTYRCVPCDMDNDGLDAWFCDGPDLDADGDRYAYIAMDEQAEDCDDTDVDVSPKGVEVCDLFGIDEDCNPRTVFGLSIPQEVKEHDKDGDGYMAERCFNWDAKAQKLVYSRSNGRPVDVGDCDDGNKTIRPGEKEVCDSRDNDCDSRVDEDAAGVENGLQREFCFDRDGDGFFSHESVMACGAPSLNSRQCDQVIEFDCFDEYGRGVEAFPGGEETCDGLDNNCDGVIDKEPGGPAMADEQLVGDTIIECNLTTRTLEITQCPDGFAWCDTDTTVGGCKQAISGLDHCNSCAPTACTLACSLVPGTEGCEESLAISVGESSACATTSLGNAVCWGRGEEGQLGNNATRNSNRPVGVLGLRDVREVCVGAAHACARVDETGDVYCWGRNREGQLSADPEVIQISAYPRPTDTGALLTPLLITGSTALACGSDWTCALLDSSEVACWGASDRGQMGDPFAPSPISYATYVNRLEDDPVWGPGEVPVFNAVAIGAGDEHGCLVNENDDVECWGTNTRGELGQDPQNLNLSNTVLIVPNLPKPVDQLAVGSHHSCVLSGGRVYCWGDNLFGQLGRPASAFEYTPAEVSEAPDATAVSAGQGHTCILTTTDEVYCWGRRLDDPTVSASDPATAVPYRVEGLSDVSVLSAGGSACARSGDEVRCWGKNQYGQLGKMTFSIGREPPGTPVAARVTD